ncbi:YopX family protein [Bacteroidota bacterium]
MKTIKYRVWNPAGKNMLHDIENVYECLKQQLAFEKSQPTRGFVFPYDHYSDGMVWMQYIGKKDSEGVEIYDGDILSEMMEIDGEMKASIEPVFYNPDVAAFCIDISFAKDQKTFELFCEEDRSKLKIIGNIYQDKEMILDNLKNQGVK